MNWLYWIHEPAAWMGLLTLLVLEIVLGIDNVVFISVLAGKLPAEQRPRAMRLGLGLALSSRIVLLFCIGWLVQLTAPVITLPFALPHEGHSISWKDLILLSGGLFLIYKAVKEIHHKLEGEETHAVGGGKAVTLGAVLAQIIVLDLVFSIDSVITAVGMVKQIEVMVIAVVVSVGIMLIFATRIARFVDNHPTVKMLALAFLVLIGVNLLAESMGQHIPKGYTYFAMGFSILVEALNLRMKRRKALRGEPVPEPVHLRKQVPEIGPSP